ncbi:hypothetical protein TrVFT333_006455 [Trichoderma virens FT-333]|nr:hypothetical protein TrVFT333_006455 [Trichoderma virens FT-333]
MAHSDSDIDETSEVSSTLSLSQSIFEVHEENGRKYAIWGNSNYIFPNDEQEQDRLVDLNHALFFWLGEYKLYQAPLDKLKNVLDVGTGTGIWAIELADKHPEASIMGADMSPIQPDMVPNNCSFEMDDLRKEWTWNRRFLFNLVFIRNMAGSLEPGGYIEIQDIMWPLAGHNDTIKRTNIFEWSELLVEAADNLGYPINIAKDVESMLVKAGFTDVTEIKKEMPINPWPEDKLGKFLGKLCQTSLDENLEGISMRLLQKGLGKTREEVLSFMVGVRDDLRNMEIHGYWDTYLVYGRKPKS